MYPDKINDFAKNTYGFIPENWTRSEEVKCLDAKDGYVLYNRLLCSPLFLDEEAAEFFHRTGTIDESSRYSEEEWDVIFEMMQSGFYLPERITEWNVMAKQADTYMNEFSQGKTFTMLDLRICEVCNFGCAHCIAGCAQSGRMMDTETAVEISRDYIELIRKHNTPENLDIEIHFGIAEPLLCFDTIRSTVLALKELYPEETINYSLNTNLTLLTREMALFFKEHNFFIHTSIDGLRKTNNKIRVYKDGRGTFDDIMAAIRLMKEVGFPLPDIGVTVTAANFAAFRANTEGFIKLCRQLALSGVAFDFDLIGCMNTDPWDLVDMLFALRKDMEEAGLDFYGTWGITAGNMKNLSFLRRAYGFCKGSSGFNLSVDSDKNVYICSCSGTPVCRLDELEESIQPGGSFYRFVKKHITLDPYDACAYCEIAGSCMGFCAVTESCATNEKYDELCEYNREVTKRLLIEAVQ